MKKCVICDCILDESNKSSEHIIHNAIGGILEDEGIYCKACNSQLGSKTDVEFTSIFAPIVDSINIHKSRSNSDGTSYNGIVIDSNGNKYNAVFRNGKIVKMTDADSKFVKYEKGKYTPLYYNFELDNNAFKKGMSKIAFNFAIHLGIPSQLLDGVFDYKNKEFIQNPTLIPFVPLTPFDCIMELKQTSRVYHTIWIFNIQNILYAYIDLFNTFQYYVVLSTHYDLKALNEGVVNIIDANAEPDTELLRELTPDDYKDMDIIACQYHIDIKKEIENLRKYHDYDNMDSGTQWTTLCDTIGKRAYNTYRTKPYKREYSDMIHEQYSSIKWLETSQTLQSNFDLYVMFSNSFDFYTIFDEDRIDILKYKKYHPSGIVYPVLISKFIEQDPTFPQDYCTMKFNML